MVAKKVEDDVLAAAMERVATEGGAEVKGEPSPPAPAAKAKATKAKPKPAEAAKAPAPAAKKKTVQVTYHPDREDMAHTVCCGLRFQANLPREVPIDHEIVSVVKNNSWFSIDGKRPAKNPKPVPRDDMDDDARSGLPPGFKVENEVDLEDALADED